MEICKKCFSGYMCLTQDQSLKQFWKNGQWHVIDSYVKEQFLQCDNCGFQVFGDEAIIDDLYA